MVLEFPGTSLVQWESTGLAAARQQLLLSLAGVGGVPAEGVRETGVFPSPSAGLGLPLALSHLRAYR